MIDVNYKASFVAAVAFYADGVKLGEAPGTDGAEATASFNLNNIEALAGKQLKSVKITAELVAVRP